MKFLFSGDPKDDKRFLFGRKNEISKFETLLVDESRLVIIKGMRKTGKTSLIQSVISSGKYYVIYIDLRDTGDLVNIDREKTLTFFRIAIQTFLDNNNKIFKTVSKYLQRIQGISFSGFSIEFDTSNNSHIDLSEIFRHLNDWAKSETKNIVLIIDEAQYLQKTISFDMSAIFAGIIDKYRSIKIVLTGSEMDLLFKFLGDEDPEALLNGKHREEIDLAPLTEENCFFFLISGFRERIPELTGQDISVLKAAAKTLGSRMGWLNEFGLKCLSDNKISLEILNEIKESVANSAKSEFEKFLQGTQKPQYKEIIEYLANLDNQFNFITYFVERESTQQCVQKLIKAGFINFISNRYFMDLVLEYALNDPNYEKTRIAIIKKANKELKIK